MDLAIVDGIRKTIKSINKHALVPIDMKMALALGTKLAKLMLLDRLEPRAHRLILLDQKLDELLKDGGDLVSQ